MRRVKQIKIFEGDRPSLSSVIKQIDNLATDETTKLGMRLGLASLGLSLIILALSFYKLPPEVPLYYSRPYGQERLASSLSLWLLPGISLVIQLIAMRGAGTVLEKDKLLAQILVWSGGLVGMMVLVSLVKIIWLVI